MRFHSDTLSLVYYKRQRKDFGKGSLRSLIIKKNELMVPRERIELSTSSLPMTRSTTELPRLKSMGLSPSRARNYTNFSGVSRVFLPIVES